MIVTLLIIIGLLLGVLGVVYWRYIASPAERLEQLARILAEGNVPRSLFIDGLPWFTRVARYLELVSSRQQENSHAIAELQFNLNAILTSMVEGVAVVDRRHVIRLANSELRKLFGLVGDPQRMTVLEALRDATVERLARETIKTGEPRAEETTIHDSGARAETRQVEVTAIPIRTEDQGVTGAVLVFNDISQIRKLEIVRREFVANVSHELRTPLSIFRGYLETLIDNPELPPEDTSRIFNTMRRHSDRLNALVEDLLTLTRMESNRIRLEPEPIQLREFLMELARDYRHKLSSFEADITVRASQDLPPLVADRVRLEQVIFNLLDNAVHYTTPPRRIEVRATCDDGKFMQIEVEDNGVGIPASDLPHIFERFYRVDKARSREMGGTGLGLSIVKHIVQQHGGKVSARSVVGEGTVIQLRLPLECSASKDVTPIHPMDLRSEPAAAP